MEQETIIAVGDIHGRMDLLETLMEAVLERETAPANATQLVFLGDYVDRGPKSKEVLDYLIGLSGQAAYRTHFLLGNHEQLLLAFLDDPDVGPAWFDIGGRETLDSYGVKPPFWRMNAEAETAKALAAAMPEAHLTFLKSLEMSWTWDGYLFVHAGLRPRRAIEEQSTQDMLWIRGEFLGDSGRFEKIIVHGHTPAETVHCDERRIGIDTGAYATEVLTALRLQGAERSLIQTRRTGRRLGVERTELPRLA